MKETKAHLKDSEASINASLREFEMRMRLHLYAAFMLIVVVLGALKLMTS